MSRGSIGYPEWRFAVILIAVVLAFGRTGIAETNYSKSVELPPLRVSFDDLQEMLDTISTLMPTREDARSLIWREEIVLRKKDLSVKMSGHQLNLPGAKVPSSIDSFEYTAFTRGDAPITRVTVSFSDYRRSVLVEGQSPEQVDAVFYVVREHLSKLVNLIGGFWFHTVLRFSAIVILSVILLQMVVLWLKTGLRSFSIAIAVCGLLLTALITLPLDELLAGFSAVRGNPSFVVRYGPEISFWDFVVGVLSFLPVIRTYFWPKIGSTDATSMRVREGD